MPPINLLAVLVSAIVTTIIGSLWYGPLFGDLWVRLMNMPAEKVAEAKARGMDAAMKKRYAIMFVATFVMSCVFAYASFFSGLLFLNFGIFAGSVVGFFMWLGFIAPVTLGSVLWEMKSWKLWILNNAYYLVVLIVMGLIFTLWV